MHLWVCGGASLKRKIVFRWLIFKKICYTDHRKNVINPRYNMKNYPGELKRAHANKKIPKKRQIVMKVLLEQYTENALK